MKMITYPVTFQETGLPYSAFWYVNLSDGLKSGPIGTGSNYTIYLSNGTYNFTATNTFSSYGAYGRDFTVNGEPIAQLTISFSNYTYPAIFEEKGLPTGTVWYVNLTPTSFSGPIPAGSNYSVELPNGTHLFTPSTSNPMYGSLIEYGNITVTGSATTMVISFTNKYNVTFKEEGLQNGIYWYVKISNGARVEELSGNSIVFQLFNGSYSYLVGDDSNYLVTPFSGSFLVKGADVFVETVSFMPLIPTTEWINSSLRFNITKYISESIHVTPTNPADVQFENNFTKFQVNGTSNVPESYGNYTINITYIDQLLINHEIQGNNANFSLTLAGGTSYSYGGVYTNNTITVGSQKLLDIETYLSSLQSTLDFNGTVFTNNYALPRIYFNFSTQGMVTIYSASSNLNGNYYYHHVFNITSTILYFNTTDYSFSPQGYGNKYQGWSVQVNPLPLLTYPVKITENGLPANAFWFFNLTNGKTSGPIPSSSTYTTFLLNGTYSYITGSTNSLYSTPNKAFSVNGASVSLSLFFAENFSVNFSEDGLPPGAIWYVNISNGQGSGPILAGSNYSVNLYNGTYAYTLSTSYPKYGPVMPGGTLYIQGSQLSETVTFGALFEDTISETGLPQGTIWYVNLSNGAVSGAIAGSSFTFFLTNGSYSYTVATSNKIYSPSPYLGSFQVNDSPASEAISFHQVKYSVTFTKSNLLAGTAWYVNITESNGTLYNSGAITSSSFSFTLTNGSYSYTIATSDKIYDPSPLYGSFTVNGSSLSKSIIFSEVLYTVTITETGLPPGESWYMNVTETNGTIYHSGVISTSSYSFSLTNGSYSYIIASANKIFAPSPISSTFSVDGSPATFSITFSAVKYAVTFQEAGLPSGTPWYVNISGMTSSGPLTSGSYSINLTNGTYSFEISTYDKNYAPNYNNSFTVRGSNSSIPVSFKPVIYEVQFNSMNLPSGEIWYVNISGQPGSGPIASGSIYTVNLTNGSYSYTIASANKIYAPNLTAGSFTVNGSPLTISVKFIEVMYNVTLQESGLPSNTQWNLTFEGTTYQLTNSSYTFSIPNGTYSFFATSHDYKDVSGTITVNGSSYVYTINMEFQLYEVTFTETGLPLGISWYVNITESNGTTYLSGPISGSSYSFSLTNGSYTYTIASANKIYAPNLTAGSFTVNGLSLSESITFSEVLYSVQFTESGLPSGTSWYVNISGMTSSGPITTNTYSIKLTNETYIFAISTFNKIYAPYYTDTFTVNGGNQNISIVFKPVVYNITFNSVSLPSGYIWYVNITETNGTIYHSGLISTSSYSFSLTNGSYTFTIASANKIYAPNLTAGSFTVNGSPLTISVKFIEVMYNVTLQESGLPSNTQWNLTFEGTTYQLTNSSYTFSIPNGTYSFFATSHDYKDVSGTITVNGSSYVYTINMEFQLYEVTFTETGLPLGISWYVNITESNGTTYLSGPISGSSYSFSLTNGSYTYTIASANKIYKPSPISSTFLVEGAQVSLSITFSAVKYTVTFQVTGLHSGTPWYVNLSNGISSGPIIGPSYNFSLTNGTYSYTISSANKIYAPNLISGSFTVNGSSVSKSIAFSAVTYVVTFKETGLPSGVVWYVNGSGLSGYESSEVSISVSLANGTYSFTVTNLSGYYTMTTHFTVVISGKNVTEVMDYYHWAYITGTISPTNANLVINGKSVSLTSSGSFNMSVPNGTYHVVISDQGYISYYINFSLNSGNAKNLIVSLVPISSPPVPSSIGLYVIIGVVIAIVVIGAAVALVKRRK
jgi:hypothetical protein